MNLNNHQPAISSIEHDLACRTLRSFAALRACPERSEGMTCPGGLHETLQKYIEKLAFSSLISYTLYSACLLNMSQASSSHFGRLVVAIQKVTSPMTHPAHFHLSNAAQLTCLSVTIHRVALHLIHRTHSTSSSPFDATVPNVPMSRCPFMKHHHHLFVIP
jgi:hypothetical protein